MKSFKDLEAWKLSIDLVVDIYELTRQFPATERYGLCAQMQRAAVSIPSSIAEGQGRHSNKEFIHFLYIAKGSLAELDTQLIICERLRLLQDSQSLYDEIKLIRVMLVRLIASLTT